jgi:CheY-like chemotaxis protein
VAGAAEVTRLFESSGGPPWCGPFASPGESPPPLRAVGGRQAGGTHSPGGASTRILLIDDQASDLDSLRLILVLQGYEVDCVQSGVEGLRRALSGDYGLVILDLHLIDLPGLDVLERFRATDDQTPLIVITGVCLGEEHERRARALGIAAFLHKPIFDDDLVPAVQAALHAPDSPASEDGAGVQRPGAPSEASARVAGNDDCGADGRDPPRTHQLVAELLPGLYRRAQRAFPGEPRQLVVDAVHDAVMEELNRRRPGREASPLPLVDRLAGAAWRNLDNLVESERRRKAREQAFAAETTVEAFAMDEDVEAEYAARQAALMALAVDEVERRGIEAWLAKAGFAEIASALGLGDLPLDEQRREVKRFKDRIKNRARRHGPKRGGD